MSEYNYYKTLSIYSLSDVVGDFRISKTIALFSLAFQYFHVSTFSTYQEKTREDTVTTSYVCYLRYFRNFY